MPKQLAGRQAMWSSLPRACGSAPDEIISELIGV